MICMSESRPMRRMKRVPRRRRGGFRLRPFLRDRVPIRRAWPARRAVRIGLPATVLLLPQSRYLASEGRNLRLCPAGDRSAAHVCPCVAIARRRPDHLGRRADGAARLHPANPGRCQRDGSAHGDRDVGLSRRSRRRPVPVRSRSRAARHQELRTRDLPLRDRSGTRADLAICRTAGGDRQAGVGAIHPGAGFHR